MNISAAHMPPAVKGALQSYLGWSIFENPSLIIALIFITGLFLLRTYISTSQGLPLPPGPKGLPIIGNLHQFPLKEPWLVYQKWHKRYGPIISLKLGETVLIILGSHEIATELLARRSKIYSSRQEFTIANEYLTQNAHFAIAPYSSRWKTHRRIANSLLNGNITPKYRAMQDVESRQLLCDLLETNDFRDRFQRYTCSLMYSLIYGRRLLRGDEPEIVDRKSFLQGYADILSDYRCILAEAFPSLDSFTPQWLAPWKAGGREIHSREAEFFSRCMDEARELSGRNWVSDVLKTRDAQAMPLEEASYLLGILNEAGADTVSSTLACFIVAASIHPDAVRLAQKELDSVVGSSRLPDFDDIKKLPYTHGFMKEVFRWQPTIPSGTPHATVQDDEYMGYQIPKGAIVVASTWSLDRDDRIYDNASCFKPERWIHNPDLPLSTFGFGKRDCPGKHLASDSLFLVISRLMWGFDISGDNENNRNPFEKTKEILPQLVNFKARFRVRSSMHADVIKKGQDVSPGSSDTILEGANMPSAEQGETSN